MSNGFLVQSVDIFSLHALFAVFGWTLATGMAIRHLHHVEGNRVVSLGLVGLCVLGIMGTWFEGAREHADARKVSEGISSIQRSLNSGGLSPDQVLSAAAVKLLQQGKQITSLQTQLDRLTKPANGIYLHGALIGRAVGKIYESPQRRLSI